MTTRSKLVIAGLVIVGVAFFVAAWVIESGGGDDSDLSVTRTEGVAGIRPQRGDEVLKQTPIGIRLDPGYRLVSIRIFDNPTLAGGIDVTAFVNELEGLNEFVYTPAEGQPVEELSADDNCVVVRFEDITRPGDIDDLDWCFTAS